MPLDLTDRNGRLTTYNGRPVIVPHQQNTYHATNPLTEPNIPRAMAPVPPVPTPVSRPIQRFSPFSDSIGSYAIGAAPQVSTNPLNNVPKQYLPTAVAQQQTPLAAAIKFKELSGSAPSVSGANIMGNAQAAMNMLDMWGDERVAAARESEIARGMGRSGVALGVENRVNYETDLAKAAEYAQYATKQAELNQQANLANQQAHIAWSELVDSSRRFAAQLAQDRELANQQARIQMAGLGTQWASTLAELAFKREELNAGMKMERERMARSANEFDRNLNFQSWAEQEGLRYNYADLGERARQFNADLSERARQFDRDFRLSQQELALRSQGIKNDYATQMADINARYGLGSKNWTDIVNDSLTFYNDYASITTPYSDTMNYLDAISPGWRQQNPALLRMWNQPDLPKPSSQVISHHNSSTL